MLDLQAIKTKTFEIKLLDGTIIHIKKANNELVCLMEEFETKISKTKSIKNFIEELQSLIIKILNHNTDHKTFDNLFFNQVYEDGCKIYDYTICMAIYKEYAEFMKGVLTNPN